MAINSVLQTIRNAEIDARSLSEFVSKGHSFTVTRRLAPPIFTLDYYLRVLNSVYDKGMQADAAISATLDKLEQLEPTVIQRVEDAISNTAIEGGVLADTFVTVTANGAGSVARTQRDKNSDTVSVKDFGAKGDGIADDAPALQKNADYMDNSRVASMYVPAQEEGYLLNNTVGFTIPTMIHGNRGATYNRGSKKKGNIVIGDTDLAFDLGLTKTTAERDGNPADQWTIKNIGFVQAPNTVGLTKTAISHTARTNGPDRGLILREVSASNVKTALHIKNNEVQTQLATLVVDNCVFSNTSLAVNAEGMVFGARFTGNQMEQSGGAIHGALHAGVTIHDNMLEGCRNTIYIKDHPEDRNGCLLSLERNYFEMNYGDYLVKMESFSNNSIISRGNYVSGFLSSDGITPNTGSHSPTDHFLLTNSYSSIYIYDSLSTTFFGLARCTADNNLSRFFVYSELTGRVLVNSRWNDAVEMSDNSVPLTSVAVKLNTDIGEIYELKRSGAYTDVPLAVQANDCIHLCFSYYSDDETLRPISITIVEAGGGGVVLVTEAGFGSEASRGGVVTCNYIFTVPTNATGGRTFRFRLSSNKAGESLSIVGASAKKIGTYNASTTNKVDNRFMVTKSRPPIYKVSDGAKFTQVLASTDVTTETPIIKTYTVTGVTANNRVETLLDIYSADLQVSARVSAPDTIQVTIKNTSSETVNIPDSTNLTYIVY